MQTIKGIAVSPGVVIGRVFIQESERRRVARRQVPPEQAPAEVARLDAALAASIAELIKVRKDTEDQMGADTANIFLFHMGMLADRSLVVPLKRLVTEQFFTAEYAVQKTFTDWAQRFRSMKDSAFVTKANDLEDLSSRVLRHLIGEHTGRLKELPHEAVVIASDLTPSQAAGFDRSLVEAFATEFGGRTSHTAIVARALGIPAVVGCPDLMELASDGTPIVVDGDRGLVILDPTLAQLDEYHSYLEQQKLFQLSLEEVASLPPVTRDGVHIHLCGNIEFPDEIEAVVRLGGGGVGLYRTEFLYLTRATAPSEEDHFQAYKRCVELLDGRPLTIRTVDLGADKYTQERAEMPERNPFLGLRSIRYCLRNTAMFRTQLRAILRASALGPIKVMFPLVTTTGEFRRARWHLNEVMEDLSEDGVPYDAKVPVGMMVEVPAAALMADVFAREVDFFSIGTNDLVQYTLAVDRTNEQVAELFCPTNPAVVRLIKDVVRVARRHRIDVSCCGESAGDLEYALLLIGIGLRTLSVTASTLPHLRRLVRSVSVAECERIARKAGSLDSDAAVSAFLRERARKIIPEAFGGRTAE
ncbi:MAG: phosphoenolpyruvate--protein phosphotransferase, partial [Phycisphaerales bacterium]|nr:phosphoenolpyruvate--protein phosphotransferase [Phycisphaerales bacterium]